MARYIIAFTFFHYLHVAIAATDSSNGSNVTSDSFFYGQSPPVYPSPSTSGTGDWVSAVQKARSLVSQMTQEEKLNITCGATVANGCSGYIAAIPRLGFEGMCLQDGSHGVHDTELVNAYPSEIHVGASWNAALSSQRGVHMGSEFRTKGANVMLGPVVGPLGRVAVGGRNWEGFSNDPYLSGALAAATIKAVQGTGVITSTKHFIGNEQETNREPSTDGISIFTPSGGEVASVSANIDDRAIHELYLWPFSDAVRAGTGNVMASYNRVNNSYSTQNSKTLNGLLKTELGFQGWAVSDWGAQHAGYVSALAGLDMMQPSCYDLWGQNLSQAITNGSVPQSRLDDMATRILSAWYKMGQDENYTTPGTGLPADLTQPHTVVNARDPSARSTLFDGAVEGHVLVKNVRNALPLRKPSLVSVFGYDAVFANENNPGLFYEYGYSPTQSSVFAAAPALGLDIGEIVPLSQIAADGTLIVGGGSGANSPPYISSPLDALQAQAYEDNTSIFWDTAIDNPIEDEISQLLGSSGNTPAIASASDACLVFINAFSTEGLDRTGLYDEYSDGLVKNVSASCNNTIVVIHNAGIRLVDQFADNPNVTAIIFAHLPGQDSGRALVSLLYGQRSFSGKLPYTVAKNESDYGPLLLPSLPEPPYDLFPQSDFAEGLYIDYRRFDALNITPRYEFGFGLSYTTFNYSHLTLTRVPNTNTQPYPRSSIVSGGRNDLWDVLASVDLQVSNTGSMDGQEVVQLYVGIPYPDTPVRQLRGFAKPNIPAGGMASVHFDLTRKDLSVWDTVAQEWLLPNVTFQIYVGASSRNLLLNGILTL